MAKREILGPESHPKCVTKSHFGRKDVAKMSTRKLEVRIPGTDWYPRGQPKCPGTPFLLILYRFGYQIKS